MTHHILHQTWKTKDITPFLKYHKSFYDIKWLSLKIYDDSDIDNYVKNNFPYFYDFFKSMNRIIEKVDFFRYCVMYKEGGIYCDIDVYCINPDLLYKVVNTNKILLGIEYTLNRYLIGQAIIISPPNNKFWIYLMLYIKNNYSALYYPPYNTGPDILSAFYKMHRTHFTDIIISSIIYSKIFQHIGTGMWRDGVRDLKKLCRICNKNPELCFCYSNLRWITIN